MQFLDAETRRELDFDAVWQRIRPVSPWARPPSARRRPSSRTRRRSWRRACSAWSRPRTACGGSLRADDLAYFLSNLRDISALVDRAGQGRFWTTPSSMR